MSILKTWVKGQAKHLYEILLAKTNPENKNAASIKLPYFYQFVRDKHRNRVGVVVCMYETGEIGWSRAHTKLDRFDKERGLAIALSRLETKTSKQVPQDVGYVIALVENRWQRQQANRNSQTKAGG